VIKSYYSYINKTASGSSLAVLRIGFGVMMFISMIRFWSKGWIDKVYIQPNFHFKYYGFEWVNSLGNYTYLLFAICAISSLFVALGFKYRWSIVVFFLSFTYIELIEKTTYLNHYYFISVLAFIMIFLPANRVFAVDARTNKPEFPSIPQWSVDVIKLLMSTVYFYAGLAKINSDWLLRAMPLKIWLPSKYDLPLIGNNLLQQDWFHFAMSWSGMVYDLAIPFLLLYKRTRTWAFALVVIFHVFTRVLFPIGMFPYIMVVGALIFFDSKFHDRVITFLRSTSVSLASFLKLKAKEEFKNEPIKTKRSVVTIESQQVWIVPLLAVFMLFQLAFPFRYALYEDELFWTEEGYRFSWRVMLMDKVGYITFTVVDPINKNTFQVNNSDFLNSYQEKQMSFQPDFILEYAHYLKKHFEAQGHQEVAIYANSYVALNGRRSQQFVDPTVDLCTFKESFLHKTWIVPFNDEIKGL
jgi:hypothetical protein